jgi:DNA-nicking Smr family endonuclease
VSPPHDRRPPEVDLHGLRPEEALRRLERELHAARVRGEPTLLVITGAGHGNRQGIAVLRARVEAWLATGEARRRGVKSFQRVSRGGALEVALARAGEGPDGGRPGSRYHPPA